MNTKNLKITLIVNGVFSIMSALFLLCWPAYIADVTQIDSLFLRIVGFALLPFGVTVLFVSKNVWRPLVSTIIILDYTWVIGSIIILLVQPIPISVIGLYAITLVMIIVTLFAYLQQKCLL